MSCAYSMDLRTGNATGRTAGVVIRFLAACLITNSHLDLFYPYAVLSTGGALGNAFFFFVSGYGLTASFRREKRPFAKWYYRRVMRIFPCVWVVMCLYPLLAQQWSWPWHVYNFVWPQWSFLQVILLAYIAYYILLRCGLEMRGYLMLLGVSFVPNLYAYCSFLDLDNFVMEGEPFKWILCLQCMLLGGAMACRDMKSLSANARCAGFVALMLFGVYMCIKVLLHQRLFLHYQIAIAIPTLGIVAALHLWASSPALERILRSLPGVMRVIRFVSRRTLEIYVLQVYIMFNPAFQKAPFPANIVIAILVLLGACAVIFYLAERLRKGLEYMEEVFVIRLKRLA